MQEVKVKTDELTRRVKANAKAHRARFEQALEQYRVAMIAELEEWLERARKGENVLRATILIQPQDHTKDYERVLDMLDMSVDDTITLQSYEFSQYVRDEWEWKGQFEAASAVNTRYLASKGLT
jgi:hypothetical protein